MDSEEIEDTKKTSNDDLMRMAVDSAYKFDWMLMFIVFIVFLVVISDVYADTVLSRVDNALKDGEPTVKGHLVQAAGLIVGTIISRLFIAFLG